MTDLSETDITDRIRRLEAHVLPGRNPGTEEFSGVAPEGHDHSGETLGQQQPLQAMGTDQLSGVDVFVGQEDDIQSKIDGAPKGATVKLEDGVAFDSTLSLGPAHSGLTLIGGGTYGDEDTGGTTLISNITDGSHVIEIDAGTAGDAVSGLTLQSFSIKGSGSEGDGIHFVDRNADNGRYYRHHLYNVQVRGCGGQGFYLGDKFFNNRFERCTSRENGSHGYVFNGNGNGGGGRLRVVLCAARSNGGDGFREIGGPLRNAVYEQPIENDSAGVGMNIWGSDAHEIRSPRLEEGGSASRTLLLVDGDRTGRQGTTVKGGIMSGTDYAIRCVGAQFCKFEDISTQNITNEDIVLQSDSGGNNCRVIGIGLSREANTSTPTNLPSVDATGGSQLSSTEPVSFASATQAQNNAGPFAGFEGTVNGTPIYWSGSEWRYVTDDTAV